MTPSPAGPTPTVPGSSGASRSTRTRDGFALTGPSVRLDPRTHAVRPDLADVRLAGRVFAPHFAAALRCRVIRAATVTATRQRDAGVARLESGDPFDVLEFADDLAWGIAVGPGLVGYVDRESLDIDA